MIQIVEACDDYYEPRLSNGSSCLFLPPLMWMDSQPRKSLSYDKLPQKPLRLTALKLDGSSFGIEVAKTGTVGDVKKAVEAEFRHLPKKGPGRVSWVHVWGQFCLCFEGHKLLNDTDYIGLFGIKDGDQLHFIRHYSSSYNLVKTQSEKEEFDLEDEPSVSNGDREEQQKNEQNYFNGIEIEDNNQNHHLELDSNNNNNNAISKFQYRFSHLFRCWFPYVKLSSSHMETEKRSSSSSRFPYKNSGSFKNVIRFYSSKIDSRRETCKGK